ncbi:mercaptopyruvate sulfurtransferase [Seminavis robusta]|uniref:Mercaptopyruvate sulfurtransferase n=1 Tax=Seminavis robusta TaxID=568900 RepID=A0A9N8H8P8_9STRA|nr:mercaptopyruvate sulfurtransferase [Seminavis robusta]|eukprot:Sro166_g074170.1 mercaptopyruvate sulfurtransferase (346) ;mRNA; f:48448-49777
MAVRTTLVRAWASPPLSRHVLLRAATLKSKSCRYSTSSATSSQNLLSVEDCLQLYKEKEDDGIVFVDASWYHKGGRNGRDEFEAGPRIPGARHMDMDDISTSKDLYPDRNPLGLYHMLPPTDLFAATMDEFQIKNSDRIIVYAKEGSIFTPRTWFLFRSMGHDSVQLMQGSLEDWVQAGGPVDKEPTRVPRAKDILESLSSSGKTSYQVAKNKPDNVIGMDEMLTIVNDNLQEEQQTTIIDPRGSSFAKGYIPGAIHLPYSSLVQEDNPLKLKSKEELETLFQDAGVDVQGDTPIACSCGSGVSVCHVYLALQECGRTGKTVMFDGSWNEWSQSPDSPKVVPKND